MREEARCAVREDMDGVRPEYMCRWVDELAELYPVFEYGQVELEETCFIQLTHQRKVLTALTNCSRLTAKACRHKRSQYAPDPPISQQQPVTDEHPQHHYDPRLSGPDKPRYPQ